SVMIVWGSTGQYDSPNGGRYDPLTDSWASMTSTNAPSPAFTPGVWTGTEMLVWGNGFPAGGRYDPVRDEWNPMSTSNAPTPRLAFSVVWTGREMIVWGGFSPSTFLPTNTGGRYDPARDTWTPTQTIGAPAARSGHTAASTGTSMLVW